MNRLISWQSFSISPLLAPLITLILSILFGFYYPTYPRLFILTIAGVIGGLATILSLYGEKRYLSPLVFCGIVALGGYFRTVHLIDSFEQFPFDTMAKKRTVTGYVSNTGWSIKSRMKYNFTLTLDSIDQDTAYAGHLLQIYTPLSYAIEIGDYIELHAICLKKPKDMSFGYYCMKEGITATLFIESLDYKLLYRPAYSITRWVSHCKNNLFNSFKKKLSPTAFTFFASFFLGQKKVNKYLMEKLQRQCKQWGILHYLARSGLHLIMVLSAYECMLRLIPIPFSYKYLIFLGIMGIYYLLSWASISFIRAFLLFVLYTLCSLFYIPVRFLHLLIVTCFIILIINPLHLFFLDFQLSFCLTFALGWLNQYKITQKGQYLR